MRILCPMANEWSLPTPYSLAIGHNILINAVQMVRAYAILSNGFGVEPHLVQDREDPNGRNEERPC